jgi:hypothetical protein
MAVRPAGAGSPTQVQVVRRGAKGALVNSGPAVDTGVPGVQGIVTNAAGDRVIGFLAPNEGAGAAMLDPKTGALTGTQNLPLSLPATSASGFGAFEQ